MIYQYKGLIPDGLKAISAQETGAELTKIYERDGGITPAAVVDGARPDDALLHGVFTWDDAEAGELYRQQQARAIVRAVVIVPQAERREQFPVMRAFVSMSVPEAPRTRAYHPIMGVLANEPERDQLIERFRNDYQQLLLRYKNLLELSEIAQLIQTFEVAE